MEYSRVLHNDEYGHAIITELRPDRHQIKKWPDQNVLHRFDEYPDASGSTLKAGRQYTVMVETRGTEIMVHADDENFLLGENHRVANPKARVLIMFEGGKGTLDNIRVWEGLPNPAWNANRSAWITKKGKRPQRDFAADPEFEFKYLVGNLRRRLRTENDPKYKVIIDDISHYMENIRASYSFLGAKPTKKNLAAKKKAKKEDPVYQNMMKKLAALENKELDYLKKQDSQLLALAPSKKKK